MEFKTTETKISLPCRDLSILSVTNFDELYEELISKGLQHEDVADERIPYWAELWPAAIALSEFLCLNPLLVEGKTVLEIGCGLALPSLIAAGLGARVLATDYLPEAIDFAARNALRNHIDGLRFQTLDWRRPEPGLRCDVLLASDVAYERSQFEPLMAAFRRLLNQDGILLLSEPNRYIAEPLLKKIAAQGYQTKKFEVIAELRKIKTTCSVYQITMP